LAPADCSPPFCLRPFPSNSRDPIKHAIKPNRNPPDAHCMTRTAWSVLGAATTNPDVIAVSAISLHMPIKTTATKATFAQRARRSTNRSPSRPKSSTHTPVATSWPIRPNTCRAKTNRSIPAAAAKMNVAERIDCVTVNRYWTDPAGRELGGVGLVRCPPVPGSWGGRYEGSAIRGKRKVVGVGRLATRREGIAVGDRAGLDKRGGGGVSLGA
jgi:hypothetical protein